MAKVHRLPVVKPEAPMLVAMELTQEEVDVLYGLLGAVGGDPSGRRGMLSDWPWSIRSLLEPYISTNLQDYVKGRVYFASEPQAQKKY